MKSLLRIPPNSGWPVRSTLFFLFAASWCWLLPVVPGHSQQSLVFNIDGKNYRADVSWTVKHNNTDYKAQTAHTLDVSKGGSFDLAVFFKFNSDSLPGDNDNVWGFQFSQSGELFSPASGEKRTRSNNLFQRFQISGAGAASLIITPKVWQKLGSGKFNVIGQGDPVTLAITITDGNQLPADDRTAAGRPPGVDSGTVKRKDPVRLETPVAAPAGDAEEVHTFTEATKITDTIQKVRALMDFVDKYSPLRPKSELVATAIKNIPLGISVPSVKDEDTYTYTLDYPVNLVIDSSKVKGWSWKLSQSKPGKYQLVLTDLKDSVHYFTIADLGKNAPFNLPKELRPFEKIRVRLLGETSDSFRISVTGGNPPFIVFLSKDGFPVERYVIDDTDMVRSFSKAACERCGNDAYTLEVYTSDFSTLLLRTEKAIHIRRINYLLLILLGTVGIPIGWFLFKYLRRLAQWLKYQNTLREIAAWEKKEIRDAEKRKNS